MVEESITTSVDELINLLKNVDKIQISQAAKKLDIDESVIESWVEFLVEEKIVGMEYKFTTPYIYLNKEIKKIKKQEEQEQTIEYYKEEFFKRARDKQIPHGQMKDLWKNHLLHKLELNKDFFYREAKKLGFQKIDELWIEYRDGVLAE